MPSHNPKVAGWQAQKARALELGNAGSANGVFELIDLLKSESAEVRRLAASALGKLAPSLLEDPLVAAHLARIAEGDTNPQVRQYALKALAKYPKSAIPYLDDLRDIARDPTQKEYVREAAADAVAAAQEANRKDLAAKFHWCTRCRRKISEFDLYIEYWGMNTPEYVANMEKKKFLYQRCGKKLISISFRDFDDIESVLAEKLSRYIRL